MSSVGGIGGVGGAGAVAAGGSAAGGGGTPIGDAKSVPAAGSVGNETAKETSAVEMTGDGSSGGSNIFVNTNMSTQDWCQLRTQAAEPAQEAPEIDLKKMLEWLMAMKLLEATGKSE